ncbi:MAG: RNA pseudouridine synthase, partial [Erysipelotrichia bacterium]|nr:RNA pseudouridine synthase [Erysipelotrichia bacterium]
MAVAYDKAYKLLALQEKISNSKAKELIDRGVVKVG